MRRTSNTFRYQYQGMIGLLCTLLITLLSNGPAHSFPFRVLKIGQKAPDVQFSGYNEGQVTGVSDYLGNNLLIIFWAGDIELKKRRAISSLKAVKDMQQYLVENDVAVLVVNMQSDGQKIIDEVVAEAGISIPVYQDLLQEAYRSFGVYVLPSFLFIDKNGSVSGGLGYSKDLADRLRGETDVMLGLISRKELAAKMDPEVEDVAEEIKLSKRRMQLGLVMKNKGRNEGAIREFKSALKLDPEFHQARVELGCTYLAEGSFENAVSELENALEKDPDSVQAEICLAGVRAEQGEVGDAIADLQELLFTKSRNADLQYALGSLMERKGDYAEAAKSYRKAFEIIQRQALMEK